MSDLTGQKKGKNTKVASIFHVIDFLWIYLSVISFNEVGLGLVLFMILEPSDTWENKRVISYLWFDIKSVPVSVIVSLYYYYYY